MSNMHHCRFHNTRRDLNECLSAMADGEELSPAENKERDRLLLICAEIAEDWADEIENLREASKATR